MSKYIFTGRARVADIDEMIKIMFPKDKVYNANLFRKRTIPILKEGLSTIYKIDNEIVGFICLTKKENNEILIITLFVSENYRRKGIATKLIHFSMYNARIIYENAYFSLHVNVTNEQALNLYKKLGFKITKTLPDFYLWTIPKGHEREKGKNYDGYEMEFHFEN